MRRLTVVAAAAVMVAVAFPTGASAQDDTAQVTVVQAATFDINSPQTYSFCVDGDEEELTTGDIVGPETWDAGTYDLGFGFGPGCDTPDASEQLDLVGGENVTVLLYWGEQSLGISILENDTSCAEEGVGRLVVRNGTFSFMEDGVGLTFEDNGDEVPLVEDVPTGGQDSLDLPAGVYENVEITGFGDFSEGFEQLEITEGEALVVYIAGGGDGEAGAFTDSYPLDPCPEPIEPPDEETPAEDLETPAEDLETPAVTARPAFTG